MDTSPRTLSIDIGGSHVKCAVVAESGELLGDRHRSDTPEHLDPGSLVEMLVELARAHEGYERVSVGVNGIVFKGRTISIPVSGRAEFRNFDLARELGLRLGPPVLVLNDAEMHAYGVITGRGVELVITLGTGLGSALFVDGDPVPAPHFIPSARDRGLRGGEFGDEALEKLGRKRWRKRVARLIEDLRRITNFERLYIGGGNADELEVDAPDIAIIDSTAALIGGARAWKMRNGR